MGKRKNTGMNISTTTVPDVAENPLIKNEDTPQNQKTAEPTATSKDGAAVVKTKFVVVSKTVGDSPLKTYLSAEHYEVIPNGSLVFYNGEGETWATRKIVAIFRDTYWGWFINEDIQ